MHISSPYKQDAKIMAWDYELPNMLPKGFYAFGEKHFALPYKPLTFVVQKLIASHPIYHNWKTANAAGEELFNFTKLEPHLSLL